jgi:hypothetical protein
MIHIVKAKGGYMVVTLGQKREVLATSEILKTKQAAFENIYSQAYFFSPSRSWVFAQDDTLKEPIVFQIWRSRTLGKILVERRSKIGITEIFGFAIEKYTKD